MLRWAFNTEFTQIIKDTLILTQSLYQYFLNKWCTFKNICHILSPPLKRPPLSEPEVKSCDWSRVCASILLLCSFAYCISHFSTIWSFIYFLLILISLLLIFPPIIIFIFLPEVVLGWVCKAPMCSLKKHASLSNASCQSLPPFCK